MLFYKYVEKDGYRIDSIQEPIELKTWYDAKDTSWGVIVKSADTVISSYFDSHSEREKYCTNFIKLFAKETKDPSGKIYTHDDILGYAEEGDGSQDLMDMMSTIKRSIKAYNPDVELSVLEDIVRSITKLVTTSLHESSSYSAR